MVEIAPDDRARTANWLSLALRGISIAPEDPQDVLSCWDVSVNNGFGGFGREGTLVATCPSRLDAELVAMALWALVRELSDD